MVELREQLQDAVRGAYTIGEELGGGGMSRVFVADDLALGRKVVIKVLHPELAAGVNAERFNREVQLAARLQHPHIVPVLTAGEVNGLPYYVMPFVKGDSLHTRIARGPMPIADVMNVMGDVAKALSFAHSEGVVHRDIKPDNILVSAGAATVADFGIAKAISSSRREENEALTSVGTSLGTAGYMAPEQVAGDPSLDHRADIYALGCVAYEMLTGSAPFAGKSAQQMLAAHILEQPVPVREKRPDTPPALADLVMRCMAKDPAARPQSGEDLRDALDAISVGGTGPQPSMRRPSSTWRGVAFGVGAAAAVAAIAVMLTKRRAPATIGATTIAVAPFEVLDPALGLWKEGLVDVLSRNLDGAASMHTVSPSAAIKRWEGRVDREAAMSFAKRVGAQIVVYGSLQPAGREVVNAKVWLLDTRTSASPIEMQAQDSSARMDRLSDSLSVKLLSALDGAKGAGAVRSLGSGSLPAIKAFLAGTQYFRRTQFDSAATAFRQAIATDSSFAIAHALLNQSLGWIDGSQDERVVEGTAAQRFLRPGLSPLDSLTIAAIGHYWEQKGSIAENQRQAYLAAEQATVRYPGDPLAWYLCADFRYHSDQHQPDEEALNLFNRGIEADSNFAPSYIHGVELANRYGSENGARYLKAYLARNSGDREGEALRFALNLQSPGGTTDPKLRAYIDTARPGIIQSASNALMRLPDSSESLVFLMRQSSKRPDAPRNLGFQASFASVLAARGHIAEAWKVGVASKAYAAGEIAALGLVPPESTTAVRGWIRDRNDASFSALAALAAARDTAAFPPILTQIDKVVASLKPDMPPRQKAGTMYFAKAAHAYWQLAKADTAAATKEFDALSDSVIVLPIDQFIRARLIAKTDPKRALQMMREKRMSGDIISVTRELEIGRLAEKLGDTPRAVDSYAFVAAEWQNTDNDQLKNAVKESRDALKRLDSDGRVRAQLSANPR